jgi:hypothetical protein
MPFQRTNFIRGGSKKPKISLSPSQGRTYRTRNTAQETPGATSPEHCENCLPDCLHFPFTPRPASEISLREAAGPMDCTPFPVETHEKGPVVVGSSGDIPWPGARTMA